MFFLVTIYIKKIKKEILILLSLLLPITAFDQSRVFENALNINQLYIGQNATGIPGISLSSDSFLQIKKGFFPLKISYIAKDATTSFTDSIFFNVDSVNKVSSIIFKTTKGSLVESLLLEKIGKPDHGITFIHSSKTWKVPDETIIINELDGFTTIVVLFDKTASLKNALLKVE